MLKLRSGVFRFPFDSIWSYLSKHHTVSAYLPPDCPPQRRERVDELTVDVPRLCQFNPSVELHLSASNEVLPAVLLRRRWEKYPIGLVFFAATYGDSSCSLMQAEQLGLLS